MKRTPLLKAEASHIQEQTRHTRSLSIKPLNPFIMKVQLSGSAAQFASPLQILATLLLLIPLRCACCPIPTGCANLPNILHYTSQSQLLQLSVNISTTRGFNFRPQAVRPTLHTGNMNMGQPITSNGCEGLFNFTSRNVSVETPCPWRYECDYNPQRIPAFIFHASCESPNPQGSEWDGEFCEEVYYPISYLKTNSCDPLEENEESEWSLETTTIPVACNVRDTMAELNQ